MPIIPFSSCILTSLLKKQVIIWNHKKGNNDYEKNYHQVIKKDFSEKHIYDLD